MKNEKNKEQALNDFLNDEEKSKNKKVYLDERSGLIERIDKTFVTKDGKQLLKEVY